MTLTTPAESTTALDPRSRHVPSTIARGYVVGSAEPIAPALRRITLEQFAIAVDALSDPGADLELAAIVARESVQRIAAVLRLVRVSIGSDVYRHEHEILREIDELLADLLAGDGELRALDELRARYASALRPETFGRFRGELVRTYQLRRLRALVDVDADDALARTLRRLHRARARFAAWPTEPGDDTPEDRTPIPDSFSALAPGLERTYRRGRRRWRASAAGERVDPRRWAHDVRDLGNQLELTAAAWPEVMTAARVTCRNLDAALADAMGHSALQESVEGGTPLPIDEVERSLLTSLVANARAELAEVTAALGARIYAESPSVFVGRIGSYWATRV